MKSEPHAELQISTPNGDFRVLRWGPESGSAALFLHGLSGVAEVWGPTITCAPSLPGPCYAMDQRGHGHSPKPPRGYAIRDYVRDASGIIGALAAGPVHLVGHSMGARVAMVLAARMPGLVRSAVIVDIGPEAWRANWQQTVAGLEGSPVSFPSIDAALDRGARLRGAGSLDAAALRPALREVALARLQMRPDGSVAWLASREGMKQTVISHRSRNFWSEWKSIQVSALFVRGGDSAEVRPWVAAKMRLTNPGVRYRELESVGHNIPLLAPARLGVTLSEFWHTVEAEQSELAQD